jgi:CheY-like chemotaxis protein
MKAIAKQQKIAKVLVVDDNVELLKMLQKLVSKAGHEAHLAGDGNEALRLAEEHDFDLIITDLIMPGKEGVETILTFKKLHPRTKIVAMSGGGRYASGPDYLGIAENLGVASTLVKPFSTLSFLQTVSRQLGL